MSQQKSHGTQRPIETGGIAAVDIEAINLVPKPDLEFSDPTHWSLFCISVGYRSPDGGVNTNVLFRRGASLTAERDLIERVTAWLRDRRPAEIITYNGNCYDYPILKHRARVTARESRGSHSTVTDLDIVLNETDHTDLFAVVKDDTGYNVPLASALEYHDIPNEPTHLNGTKIDGKDMPDIGVRVISGQATEAEIKAVREYAESDVEPLFALQSCVSE